MARDKARQRPRRVVEPLRRQDNREAAARADEHTWPVGSIFLSTVPTNPAVLLGFGTWVAFAQGRVLVGIDPTQVEFDTVLETGGAKTHVLTVAETPCAC